MREIKFRAWDTVEKEICIDFQETYMFSEAVGDNNEDRQEARYILMQYIGIKDKNGKEIYEGDIVCPTKIRKNKWVCQFISGRFMGVPVTKNPRKVSNICDLLSLHVEGNIYENPELLK